MNVPQTLSFDSIPVSEDWCFKNARSTEQWTHGYHRYPAKFLPNLVRKIIDDYTKPNDLIADFFAGCGTTLVEAKAHGRRSIGVDINPVAELITRAKIAAIEPDKLQKRFEKIVERLADYQYIYHKKSDFHERIDYWFSRGHKSKIAYLYKVILDTRNEEVKEFFLVALSHILKNCSRWLQSSTKPQVDPKKKPQDPFVAFRSHAQVMMKRNKAFYTHLKENHCLDIDCKIQLQDARRTTISSESVEAIITSPPYVTSYEYADIHQLTGFWFEYISDLVGFRRDFIGTFYSLNQKTECTTTLGKEIVDKLLLIDERTGKEVANYFIDMSAVGAEMYRVLKPNGRAFIVIGNTHFKDVKIKSAEVFSEILESHGFTIDTVIKRSIPYKLIPTIRNEKTGKFSTLGQKDSKLVYPEEYILIVKK